MNRQDVAADRVLAFTLRAGAYTAFVLIVAGLLMQVFAAAIGSKITSAGVVVLLATPALRVIVAAAQFLRERDYKFVLVSLGVLTIVLLAYFLGVQIG
jgi:uncharacterized membrane protein